MIIPGQKQLTGYRDRSFSAVITFNLNGSPKPLTGLTIKSEIKKNLSSLSALEEFTITRDDINGKIILSLTPIQMLAIPSGAYKYDIKITEDGVESSYLEGTFTIRDTVTR